MVSYANIQMHPDFAHQPSIHLKKLFFQLPLGTAYLGKTSKVLSSKTTPLLMFPSRLQSAGGISFCVVNAHNSSERDGKDLQIGAEISKRVL